MVELSASISIVIFYEFQRAIFCLDSCFNYFSPTLDVRFPLTPEFAGKFLFIIAVYSRNSYSDFKLIFVVIVKCHSIMLFAAFVSFTELIREQGDFQVVYFIASLHWLNLHFYYYYYYHYLNTRMPRALNHLNCISPLLVKCSHWKYY